MNLGPAIMAFSCVVAAVSALNILQKYASIESLFHTYVRSFFRKNMLDHFINTHQYIAIAIFLSLIFVSNIPIGLYRKRFEKFSRPWARCIYVPILVNIVLRRFLGFGYGIIPVTILFVIAGQFIGDRIGKASS